MDTRPVVEAAITANTAACAVFILADGLKRQGLLDDEAISHLLHLLDGQIEDLEPGSDVHRLHEGWRRRLAG